MMLDRIDLKILSLLQKDSSLPLEEIANRVHLSKTPCWNRIKKLEKDGIIKRRVAILDPTKLELGTSVFLMIQAREHTSEWMERFSEAVSAIPQITACYRMSGSIDYLIQVRVKDVAAYDRFYKKLVSLVPLADVSSSFALEEMKFTTALALSDE